MAWSSEPQLTPMRTGLVVVDRDLDDRREVLVVALRADVPWVDAVLGERRGHLGVLGQELVPVVVEVADDRDVDAESAHLADHLGDRGRRLLGVDRDADELRPGVGEARDLDGRRVGIGGVGVRHRLDDDGMRAADEDPADVDADRRVSAWPRPGRAPVMFRRHRRPSSTSTPVIQIRNANRKTNPTM